MHELTGFYHFMFQPQGAAWYTGAFWSNQTQWTVVWLPTLVVVYRRRFECREKGCWRFGHYQVEGTHYKTCAKHATEAVHGKLKADHLKKHSHIAKLLKKEK